MDIDFFVLGSQRCGTTWIDTVLRSSGAVLLPINKQTYFFDRNYSKGFDWYRAQFTASPNHDYKLTGEIATGYCLDGAIDRLAESFPKAKVILVVREPVARAYSNYQKRNSDYPDLTFEQAIAEDTDLVARGLYGEMLERIRARYSEQQVKVVYFEDLQMNPEGFIADILDFLGVEIRIDPAFFSQDVNSSIFEKWVRLSKKYKMYFLVRLAKTLGLTSFARQVVYRLNRKKRSAELSVSDEISKRFYESNRILEGYTGRKFQ